MQWLVDNAVSVAFVAVPGFSSLAMMALATLLTQIRTGEALLIKQMCVAASVVGFPTTTAIVASRLPTFDSRCRLMKRPAFAQNVPKPDIETMDQ